MRIGFAFLAAAAVACVSRNEMNVSPSDSSNQRAPLVSAAPKAWGTLDGVSIVGGFGSGIVASADGTTLYIVTDRGPNVETSSADELFFPVPTFTPQIGKFVVAGDSVRLVATIELTSATGKKLTGIPNPASQGGTGETAIGPDNAVIPPDPDGVDIEAITLASDGSFWLSDEYGPHILHVDPAGRTIERINPFGTGTGGRMLPLVLAKRRPNRGLEGLTITPDGKTLIGIMQSPLDNPNSSVRKGNNVVRVLAFDIASGATRQFLYVMDAPGLHVNDIAAITDTSFLVLERDGGFQGDAKSPAVYKRIYRMDITGATDVSDAKNSAAGRMYDGRTIEQLTAADRSANGIVTVRKSLVYDLLTHPSGYPHDKAEGLALIGGNTIVVTNDDDFGIVPGRVSRIAPKLLPSGARDRLDVYFIKLAIPLR